MTEGIDELTRILMQMSSILFSEETVQGALDRICLLAREALAGSSGAGVTVVRSDQKFTAAMSDEDPVQRADALQYELDEGPCLSAWRDKKLYRIDSMAEEKRWPRWTAAAAGMGIASSISAPMVVGERALGAIKVYSSDANHYADGDEQILQMLADQAAVALSNVLAYEEANDTIAQLKQAIDTRDTIGMAKGILIAQEGIDEERAFDMLRVASQSENVKLREIARKLVEKTARRETP